MNHLKNHICRAFILIPFILFLPLAWSVAQDKQEDTYSITLVKTAETDNKTYDIGDKRVVAETYRVERGDYLWKIFRNKGLLKKRKLAELISLFKKLNASLKNIDLILPDQKILIPLTVTPIKGAPLKVEKAPEQPASIETLQELDIENYTVKSGDSLVRVIKGRFDIPKAHLYNEYLDLVKKMNPSIKDLGTIYPGQVVRLPVYTPQVVRLPVIAKAPPPSQPKTEKTTEVTKPEPKKKKARPKKVAKRVPSLLGPKLGEIFRSIGEEWIQEGQHFIPLKSGGQINLKADSFPIINLANGDHVIVDLNHELPEEMTNLIVSSWDSYRVVHLEKPDDLKGALDKILPACRYPKIFGSGESLKLNGEIPVQITADWIINQNTGGATEKPEYIVVTIGDEDMPPTPPVVKDYLNRFNVKVVDYPQGAKARDPLGSPEILRSVRGVSGLVAMLLNMSGKRYASNAEIPVYQSQKTGYNLIIKADFLFNIKGKDSIIDLTGLGPDVLSLLKDHQFSVLTLADEKDPTASLSKTLKFLGTKFYKGPHPFLATGRDTSRNIKFTIQGITFLDQGGQRILATHTNLPSEIAQFLSDKGYKILSLTLSS